MKYPLMLLLAIWLCLSGLAQPVADLRIETFKDSLDRSSYPILYFEAYTKHFGVTYWSNLEGVIYPYVNIYFIWRNWYLSWNPLKPDEYNNKLQVTFNITL
jgi:hypothetical protein